MRKNYLFSKCLPGLLAAQALLLVPNRTQAQDYKLVWSDEFNTPGAVNTNNWTALSMSGDESGNWEREFYLPDNATVGTAPTGEGSLVITAKRQGYGGKNFTSARLTSKNKVYFKYGKVEARVMIPKTANGLWPAFWLMGNNDRTWPANGEIDVLEMGAKEGIDAGTQDRYYTGACHWGPDFNVHYMYDTHNTADYSLEDGKFHTFTLEWDENAIKMFLDNSAEPYYSMDISSKSSTKDPGSYFSSDFYILLNLAVGGINYVQITDDSQITALNNGDAKMYIDYVRVYQKEGQEDYTTPDGSQHNGPTDTFTDNTKPGSYATASLDADSKSTFDFDNSSDYVLVGVSDGVKDMMGDKVIADYRPGVANMNMNIWEQTMTANTSEGVNSFGLDEPYTDLSTTQKGWSGIGYAGSGLDYSMLDDSYFVHFAMKSDDPLTHTNYAVWLGNAKFAIGSQDFIDGAKTYPALTDFPRDGKWYSFDIPLKVLRELDPNMLAGSNGVNFNILSVLSGISGRLQLDNIFFYKNPTKSTDSQAVDNTRLGDYGYKSLTTDDKPVFDVNAGKDYVLIGTSQGVKDMMGDKVRADYNVDNEKYFLYIWENTMTAEEGTGVNSFGLDEPYNVFTVGNMGWSGLGYAGAKDLSMLNDDYYLHFSVKGDDAIKHSSQQYRVGNAHFTIGHSMVENADIIGDYKRDGEWYSFDIPFTKIKQLANPVFSDVDGGPKAYHENVFAMLGGGNEGDKVTFDNVFFYVKDQSTGINTITTDTANTKNGYTYNLAGQRVNASYRGIVIRNGKKYINK